MSHRKHLTDPAGQCANSLDHAQEFAGLIARDAPGEYAALLASNRFDSALQEQAAFNHGKLYAYAEFVVFRREFTARFPDASTASCINAFSGLFLKNDISISNLVEFIEGGGDQARLLQGEGVS